MRRMEMMTAGGVTLAGLGALVGLAIGSGDRGTKLTVPRAQPVEVRTEIIRRTVNVYRREHPHHAAGTGPAGGSSSGISASGASAVASVQTRTRTQRGRRCRAGGVREARRKHPLKRLERDVRPIAGRQLGFLAGEDAHQRNELLGWGVGRLASGEHPLERWQRWP